ncbi:vacuolar cation/proton exchanger 1a-like [Phragmites australis]|uniref:vacuolar cation/proton exchanger 1a-like n=1 Tax=Phragmites australis TaxID=29695 RepID=UPI002D7896F5|nr:vacuolar cation/proton exchanger 1a-like [Phragmites australis]
MEAATVVVVEAGRKQLLLPDAGGLRQARHGAHGHSAHARTAHSMSSSSLRKKSDASLVRKVPFAPLRPVLANLQEVFLGTKLAVLFPAVPLAIAAQCAHYGQVWVFSLSLLGLIPLAERVSFLTEQIALYTGPTLGGLLNATCGNATELIIALFALMRGKIEVVKCSLLGSVLSNLLLVLGTSLFCGGIVNLGADQPYDRKQSDVSTGLLILGLLCQSLPLMLRYAVGAGEHAVAAATTGLELSRACSIVMLLAYVAYLFFQLKTHSQLFEPQEVEDDGEVEETPVLGLASGFFWLAFMTVLISILSEYVVGTIEPTSLSWGLSVSFISIILLPIVGNAAEHAGAIIFALKNKLDITLGVALGSATQISMFVIPLSVIVAWIAGIQMDLDFKLLETGSLFISVLVTAFTLQDGTSHYLKGILLLLCYIVIGACFFVTRQPASHANSNGAPLAVPTGTWNAQVA